MNLRPPGYEPDELPTALLRDIKFCGAGDRTRTGTVSLPGDFKSPVSTNSTTPAACSAGFRIPQDGGSVKGSFEIFSKRAVRQLCSLNKTPPFDDCLPKFGGFSRAFPDFSSPVHGIRAEILWILSFARQAAGRTRSVFPQGRLIPAAFEAGGQRAAVSGRLTYPFI